MKCPKCGYNSFEYLDSCKKCSCDLLKFKESLGIRADLIPLRRPAEVPASGCEELAVDSMSDQDAGEMFVFDSPHETDPSKVEDALSGLDPGFPVEKMNSEVEPFSFNKDVEPESPADPPKAIEAAFGEFSFQDIANKAEEQALQPGNADPPPADEMFADLLETSTPSGSKGEEEWAATANEFNPEALQEFEENSLEETGKDTGSKPAASVGEYEMDDFVSQLEESDVDSASANAAPEPATAKDQFDSLFGEAPLKEGKRA